MNQLRANFVGKSAKVQFNYNFWTEIEGFSELYDACTELVPYLRDLITSDWTLGTVQAYPSGAPISPFDPTPTVTVFELGNRPVGDFKMTTRGLTVLYNCAQSGYKPYTRGLHGAISYEEAPNGILLNDVAVELATKLNALYSIDDLPLLNHSGREIQFTDVVNKISFRTPFRRFNRGLRHAKK